MAEIAFSVCQESFLFRDCHALLVLLEHSTLPKEVRTALLAHPTQCLLQGGLGFALHGAPQDM